ncbi:dTDP-4-dehydrorhamnose reductase [Herbaspirillum aquaticum]|jgi:dTDP-4-dehydrorhamnose reductase|uniref:dTDP-4-dehydrorhamnose reductase n=1 Tax=Herbaspirillum aquaticum TaxID=568783 RepID=UPI0024DE8F6C|nr:dTDP-4-dehydrorhamnose reductase [Herbaspirillum aquaticum]
MNAPRILLTGSSGQVGHALTSVLQHAQLITPGRAELDLANAQAIADYVDKVRPDLIINPAAYTAVDRAESEPHLAEAINGVAPAMLAEAAERLGIPLIHFSTDYVFDGLHETCYAETQPTSPVNVYGRSKRNGELAALERCEAVWILRTSWVYGAHGKNFLNTILRLAQERDSMQIVDDQWGSPTWSRTIASVVATMLGSADQRATLTERIRHTRGIYHLTATGHTNWHQYACRVVEAMSSLGLHARLPVQAIAAIATEQYPTPARRPRNSRLCTDKISQTFGIELPPWDRALAQCLQEIQNERSSTRNT